MLASLLLSLTALCVVTAQMAGTLPKAGGLLYLQFTPNNATTTQAGVCFEVKVTSGPSTLVQVGLLSNTEFTRWNATQFSTTFSFIGNTFCIGQAECQKALLVNILGGLSSGPWLIMLNPHPTDAVTLTYETGLSACNFPEPSTTMTTIAQVDQTTAAVAPMTTVTPTTVAAATPTTAKALTIPPQCKGLTCANDCLKETVGACSWCDSGRAANLPSTGSCTQGNTCTADKVGVNVKFTTCSSSTASAILSFAVVALGAMLLF